MTSPSRGLRLCETGTQESDMSKRFKFFVTSFINDSRMPSCHKMLNPFHLFLKTLFMSDHFIGNTSLG